jgi:NTE family protein
VNKNRNIVIVLSGGVGLGVYQAGAYAALHERQSLSPGWVAGSSIGAINAAVIAGNAPNDRIDRLRALWAASRHPFERAADQFAFPPWNHAQNWVSAMRTKLTGAPGHFHPRLRLPWQTFSSLYDLEPLRARFAELIDFGRLNSGETRVTIGATNLESGDLVMFDTAKGDKIEADHLMASCGFFPEFAPIEIDGQMLGDGGLAANAPIEALWDAEPGADLVCFVLDLYARDGQRPVDLESAMSRKNDLIFSNQTWQRLLAFEREERLRQQLAAASAKKGRKVSIFYLSYRPSPEEAGSERGFDYSARVLEQRWNAGASDMADALEDLAREDLARVPTSGRIPGVYLSAVRQKAAA